MRAAALQPGWSHHGMWHGVDVARTWALHGSKLGDGVTAALCAVGILFGEGGVWSSCAYPLRCTTQPKVLFNMAGCAPPPRCRPQLLRDLHAMMAACMTASVAE